MIKTDRQRRLAHVTGILIVALLGRIALFNNVGVFGDFGYWAYDSRMIANGQQPFIDFPGRSPLMVYLLAAVRDTVGHVPVSLRGTVIVLWTATGLPVYALAQDIRDHTTGLVAMVLFLLLPFPLIYGMFLNSQGLGALLGMTGFYLVYRYESYAAYAVVGVLLGLAFMSRRSVIVYLGPIGLFTLWRCAEGRGWTDIATWTQASGRGVVLGGVYLATLFVGYLGVAGWDITTGIAVMNLDFVGLFTSHGRGSYPMIGQDVPPVNVEVKNGLPIINELCPTCGSWTARRGLRMLILASPVVGLFFYYFRDLTHHYFTDTDKVYLLGGLAPLAVYAMYLAISADFYWRAVLIVALIVFAYVVYQTPRVTRDILYSPGMAYVGALLVTIIMGYLYRERRIIVYYMMDGWPAVAVIAGVILTVVWRQSDRQWRVGLIVAIALGIAVSTATAAPLADVAFRDSHWFAMSTFAIYSEDINQRAGSTDRVLTGHPNYIVGSEPYLYANSSRIYNLAVVFDDTAAARTLSADLRAAFENGEIEYVYEMRPTRELLRQNESVQQAFQNNYCAVPDGDVYEQTNATLYRHQPDCPEGRQWT